MKVNSLKNVNGNWERFEDEVPWYKHYWYVWLTIYWYYKNKLETYLDDHY